MDLQYCSLTLFVIFLLLGDQKINCRECESKDFIYTYTECVNKTQWRVAVPGTKCVGGTVSAPQKAYVCGFQCPNGQHLPLKKSKQECENCPGGTYSFRGGLRVDHWNEMPKGFHTKGERTESVSANGVDCSGYKWIPKGTYLASPSGKPCSAVLRYTVNMAVKGRMTMRYKYMDSASLFTVEVQNDQCQVSSNIDQNWVKPTSKSWKDHHVDLGKGRNRIFIVFINDTANADGSDDSTPLVMIQKLQFSGVAFDQSCSKCIPGTHATSGSSICDTCKADTFSKEGSSECTPCPAEKYSLPGSSDCTVRPKCKKTDYYAYWGECTAEGAVHMKKMYAWVQPKVCLGGVALPESGKETKPCSASICNAGSYRANTSSCDECPVGQTPNAEQGVSALGNTSTQTAEAACHACPPNSQPVNDIVYNRWWIMPAKMSSMCINLSARKSDDCAGSGHWVPMGDHIRSGHGLNAWFSILELEIDGFIENGGEFSGYITFDFEMTCSDKCKLYFMVESGNAGHFIAHQWSGDSAARTRFRFALRHKGSTKFVWIFERPTVHRMKPGDVNTDFAVIYSINVTNVKGAPASACERCPVGVDKKCVPCPSGQYFDSSSGHCVPCPAGSVVWRTPARSKKDCRACGPGLRPHNGNSCAINLSMTTKINGRNKGHKLDALKGNQSLTGVHLFTSRGTEYHHVFRFTIDNGQPTDALPVCSSNLTTFGTSRLREIRALVCQFTLVPPRKKGGRYLSAQPVSLGDRLANVTSTNHTSETFEFLNRRLEEAGWPRDDDNLDLHLTYVTQERSRSCSNGRSTIVTLRCDPKSTTDRGQVELPPKCPDGTCDGCNFHFLWKSRAACPICYRADYDVVVGQCVRGQQELHYYPPKYCYFSVDEKHEKIVETVTCPLLTTEAEIAIIVVMIVGIILVTLLGYFWKRNRKLEYKYMKLVEGQGGRPGELPQAESCAVHEGEEEDDDVHIKSSGGSSSAFFSRFKQFRKTNTFGGDRMETVNLTDRDEFGL